jgi:hypothetical protein
VAHNIDIIVKIAEPVLFTACITVLLRCSMSKYIQSFFFYDDVL